MKKFKVITAGAIGNALEFYDFTLYGVFASIIATLYFPDSDPINSLIASWGAFAAGFIARPFGAVIFGYVGDHYGRRAALTASILLMGLPTLIIGCLPTYHTIGIAAPIILVGCRLLQGFSAGGEYNGSAIFSIEHLGMKRAGFFSGVLVGSCYVGVLLAQGLAAIIVHLDAFDWMWRLPFILGFVISLFAFYMRRNLDETPDFNKLEAKHEIVKMPLLQAMKSNSAAMLVTFAIGGFAGSIAYSIVGFVPSYLSIFVGIDMKIALKIGVIGVLVYAILSPVMGIIFDMLDAKKYYKIMTTIAIVAIFVPFKLFQTQDSMMMAIGIIVLGTLASMIGGPHHGLCQSLFPITDRYSGIAFSFSSGMALMGGTIGLLSTYLMRKYGNLYTPAIIIACNGVFFLICVYYYFRVKVNIGS